MRTSAASRRRFLKSVAALGVGSTTFQRALAAQVDPDKPVTAEMVQQAEWIAGLTLTDEERKKLAQDLTGQQRGFAAMRAVPVSNSVPPAINFNPAPWLPPAVAELRLPAEPLAAPTPKKPDSKDDLAFLPLSSLCRLVRAKQVSSVDLTKLYLDRLHQYDPVLKCVVSFTDELALKQAEQADREIASGKYRGPLHGIPWGAKDLIAYPGYKTTWGAEPTKDQMIDAKATIAQRLDEAGAVLVAKTTLGALAQGDLWFGGMTRNPWNAKQGSSGSSAGSAAAVAAGLVGFAIGTETLGSIVSPCTRCGATGLRPTFGRVSRHGCMALAWSMDKLGPIARCVEDCALVLAAIHGFDGHDACAVDRPFAWPPKRDIKSLKVGYVEGNRTAAEREELRVLKDLGVELVAIKLPDKLPIGAMRTILTAEASAAFDDFTRQGIRDGIGVWPNEFRRGEFIPAVEYIRANRLRTLLMRAMAEVMTNVDLYVGGGDLLITNLTGHPTVVMPNGLRKQRESEIETPISISFTGRLYGESELLAVARAYQDATGHHLKRPPMEKLTVESAGST
jgi:Asp-tRNA(Asn)/Glu-tRNA(Gln) amidotransferase A subunit family amidase